MDRIGPLKINNELSLLAHCAHLHYRENKSQTEIADQLDINRSKVSRLMKRIVDEGYVEVNFRFPALTEISARLCSAYGLRDAVVIASGNEKYLKEDIGGAAARYFERVVGKGARIGISCGTTLYEMVRQIRVVSERDIKVYPLAADNAYESVDIFPNTLVGMLVAKLKPNAVGYALPGHIGDDEKQIAKRRKQILEEERFSKIFREAEDVDLAFIGVGALENGVPGFCSIAEDHDLHCEDIAGMGDAVGEYNYTVIDSEGRPLASKPEFLRDRKFQDVTDRIINVSLETVSELARRQGKLVVCVAGGANKVKGIHAVLKGRLANVIITDLNTAQWLLNGPVDLNES